MRRDLCRHGKAAPKAASIQDSFELTTNRRRGRLARLHDLRYHGLEIAFPHQAKRDAVAEFRVQACEAG